MIEKPPAKAGVEALYIYYPFDYKDWSASSHDIL